MLPTPKNSAYTKYPFGSYQKPQISDLVVLAAYPFGSILSSVSKGVYRYGMNTQEKDNEIYGEGNSYTAEYWQYDARLGRRWNVDPVVKQFESPYSCFSSNPIFHLDINGDVVTPSVENGVPTITAKISVRFQEGISNEQKQEYQAAIINQLQQQYGSLFHNGSQASVSFTVEEYTGNSPFGSSNDERYTKAINSVLIDIGTSQNNGNTLSNAEKKGGYIFLNSGNVTNDINHEFGHILGLSDRYSETVSYNSSISGGGRRNIINNLPAGGRDGTIPLEIKSDKEHNSQTNLMSNPQGGTGTITSQQSNIIFNNKSEKQYFRPVILRDASPSNSSIQDNLYNSVRAQNIFGIFSKVTPYRNGAKINIVSENPVTWFNNRAGFISSHGMYKRQYNSWPSGDNKTNNISNIRRALNAP
jgi:hypothetical protein